MRTTNYKLRIVTDLIVSTSRDVLYCERGIVNSQKRPAKPGAQRQLPSSGSQSASFSQLHAWRHSTPYEPCAHGVSQSAPRQPGGHRQRPSAASHSGPRCHSNSERFAAAPDCSALPNAALERLSRAAALELELLGLRLRCHPTASSPSSSSSGGLNAISWCCCWRTRLCRSISAAKEQLHRCLQSGP